MYLKESENDCGEILLHVVDDNECILATAYNLLSATMFIDNHQEKIMIEKTGLLNWEYWENVTWTNL